MSYEQKKSQMMLIFYGHLLFGFSLGALICLVGVGGFDLNKPEAPLWGIVTMVLAMVFTMQQTILRGMKKAREIADSES